MEAGASDVQPAKDDDGKLEGYKASGSGGCTFVYYLASYLGGCSAPGTAASSRPDCWSNQVPRGSHPYPGPTSQGIHGHVASSLPRPLCPPSDQVLMSVEEFGAVSSGLHEQGVVINLEGSGLVYMPLMVQEVDDDAHFEANEAMLERLLAVDDVDAVYTNCGGLQ